MTDTAAKRQHALQVSRAWKRILLDADGGLKEDARIVLKELMDFCQYFGPGYVLGNHDKTLEMAVMRRVVNHILVAVDISETHITKRLEIGRDDDD